MTESKAYGEGYQLGAQTAALNTLEYIHANMPIRNQRQWVLQQINRITLEQEREARENAAIRARRAV